MSPPFNIVIPARLGSIRLPEKPLVDLGGAPLVVRVWERAVASGAEVVVVAADDERIVKAVVRAGGEAQLTSQDHASGTDRIAEVAAARGWDDQTIVVNLQGDEPLVPELLPRRLAASLADHPAAGIATVAVPIDRTDELFDPNVVKAVRDDEGFAMLFTRAPVPWIRDSFANGPPSTLTRPGLHLRHIGVYAYRVGTLRALAAAPTSALELAESLEQLRAMAMGVQIHVSVLDEAPPAGIDTSDDLERVRAIYEGSTK